MRVEAGAAQEPQLAEHAGAHLLDLVDQEHRTQQRTVEMTLPAFAQGLETTPTIVGSQSHPEDLAHLAIEIGQATLRVRQHADRHVAHLLQPIGEDPHRDTLAAAWVAADQREAPFTHQALLMNLLGSNLKPGNIPNTEKVTISINESHIFPIDQSIEALLNPEITPYSKHPLWQKKVHFHALAQTDPVNCLFRKKGMPVPSNTIDDVWTHRDTDFITLLDNDFFSVDFIGRYETIDEDWEAICKAIGKAHEPLPRLNKTTSTNSYREYLSSKQTETLTKYYENDLTQLGY